MAGEGFSYTISATDESAAALNHAMRSAKTFGQAAAHAVTSPFRALSSLRLTGFLYNVRALTGAVTGLARNVKGAAVSFAAMASAGLRDTAVMAAFQNRTGLAADDAMILAKQLQEATRGALGFDDTLDRVNRALAMGFSTKEIATFFTFAANKAKTTGRDFDEIFTAASRAAVTGVTRSLRAYVQLDAKAKGTAAIMAAIKKDIAASGMTGREAAFGFDKMAVAVADIQDNLQDLVGTSPIILALADRFREFAERARAFVDSNFSALQAILDRTAKAIGAAFAGSISRIVGLGPALTGLTAGLAAAPASVFGLAKGVMRIEQAFHGAIAVVHAMRAILAEMVALPLDLVVAVNRAFTAIAEGMHSLVFAMKGWLPGGEALEQNLRGVVLLMRVGSDSANVMGQALHDTAANAGKAAAAADAQRKAVQGGIEALSREQGEVNAQLVAMVAKWEAGGDAAGKQLSVVGRMKLALGELVGKLATMRSTLAEGLGRVFKPLGEALKSAAKSATDGIKRVFDEAARRFEAAADKLEAARRREQEVADEAATQRYETAVARARTPQEQRRIKATEALRLEAAAQAAPTPERRDELLGRGIGIMGELGRERGVFANRGSREWTDKQITRMQATQAGYATREVGEAESGLSRAARERDTAETEMKRDIARAAFQPVVEAGRELRQVMLDIRKGWSGPSGGGGQALGGEDALAGGALRAAISAVRIGLAF